MLTRFPLLKLDESWNNYVWDAYILLVRHSSAYPYNARDSTICWSLIKHSLQTKAGVLPTLFPGSLFFPPPGARGVGRRETLGTRQVSYFVMSISMRHFNIGKLSQPDCPVKKKQQTTRLVKQARKRLGVSHLIKCNIEHLYNYILHVCTL